MTSKIDKVVEILVSESHQLNELAVISGRSPFRFYNGADLSGLDLSNQNLIGLNFDNADLRLSKLDGVLHDRGCFNRSILDNTQQWLKDEYEYNAQEIIDFPVEQILLFVRIRPSTIDTLIAQIGLPFGDFAGEVRVSTASVRKARQGKVIAMETAQAILEGCRRLMIERSEELYAKYGPMIEQPCASILAGGNNSPFRPVDHIELERLFLIRRLRIQYMRRSRIDNGVVHTEFRDTADYLKYYAHLLQRDDIYEDE